MKFVDPFDKANPGWTHELDRRTTIKWIVSVTATMPAFALLARTGNDSRKPTGFGADLDVQKTYKSGELWSLTFTPEQRKMAKMLCDAIIPADDESPSASQVGVVDFIDEWISAPYAPKIYFGSKEPAFGFALDRTLILEGFCWLDSEALKRFRRKLADLDESQLTAILDDICYMETARPEHKQYAKFFARFRDLTAGGFYTTPEGTKDLNYVGNVPMVTFDGPPIEVLKIVGLA